MDNTWKIADTADFNGDGKADLVTADRGANTVSVAPRGSMAASPRLIERVAMLRCILFKKGVSRHASSITSLSFFAFSTPLEFDPLKPPHPEYPGRPPVLRRSAQDSSCR